MSTKIWNANTVTENFLMKELVYQEINDAATEGEYTVDMTDCKGELDLLLDATDNTADVTMTICGGAYPGGMPDTAYTIPKGTCQTISISSGETMKTDGLLHLLFSAGANLGTLHTRIAVLKRRYVTNH